MSFRTALLIFLVILVSITLVPVYSATGFAEVTIPGFFRYPATYGKYIVFTSEGDLWRVPVNGGMALRLTTHEGDEQFAHFSPDGKWIAFTGQDNGQDDVFIIPANGGEPKRLTYHPDRDQMLGWDNKGNVLFRSSREIPYRGYRVYSIPVTGGLPEVLPIDKAALISFEPDGKRVAFNRYSREFRHWKRYQGGWAQDIWVGDLEKSEFHNLTDNPPINEWDGTDAFPMWHTDGRIYFMSDRDGRANIYSMLPDGSDLKRHTRHEDFDVRWPSLGAGVIVYQHGMDIWKLDIASNTTRQVEIILPSDRVQARSKFVDPKKYITDFQLSPDGARVLFCSRGEIFTAPSKGEGLIRQLTFTSGIREKSPRWSPDGESIVIWSDESSEEQLYTIPVLGGKTTKVGTDKRGWHYPATWSPDGKSLAFSNEELELVVMDAASGDMRIIDQGSWEITEYSWSPDSRFLVYARPEENSNETVRIWDSQSSLSKPVTDDFYNSYSPCFDPEGKYLYFLSDRVANPHLDGQEMTYILDKRTRVLLVSLKKDTLSPFAAKADPKGDDDEDKPWKKWKGDDKKGNEDNDKKETVKVEIDFDDLAGRIDVFPVPASNYFALSAVKNRVFFCERENEGMFRYDYFDENEDRGFTLLRFDIKRKKLKTAAENINGYDISYDGEKLLVRRGNRFTVTGIDEGGEGEWKGREKDEEDKDVDLSGWDLNVDVRAEWQQMFDEAWRLQRDFFWDPNMHWVNWDKIYKQYKPLTKRISTRDELNDLIGEVFAELGCSHTYIGGGDQRSADYLSTGLLGVDVSRHSSGFYRIERVYKGHPWTPNLSSPLAAAGIDAKPGEFIVAINGQSTASVDNYLELLQNKADKTTSVILNSKPSLDGGREVIVKPLSNERALRYITWVDDRRDYVNRKSDGQIAYIHLTDMGGRGLSQFTEAYLPQHNKPAMIMDVRYNGGGFVAEMILSHLSRRLWAVGKPRHGDNYRTPQTAFHGYLAAVCNGETGSDGETFTEGFQRMELGPVIGTRTWGGWVGIRGGKPFIDFGGSTQPEFTGWGLEGKYLIEGHGTDPDQVVKEDPGAFLRGEDPQLDATIAYLLDKLKNDPKPLPQQPPFPDRSLHLK